MWGSPSLKKVGRRKLCGTGDVVYELRDIAESDVENFVVFTMTIRYEIINRHVTAVGSLLGVIVDPRTVFRRLLEDNAAVWICAHNHPSGDADPSVDDIEITKRLSECSDLFGIQLLDHVIVTNRGEYVSLSERNKLRG